MSALRKLCLVAFAAFCALSVRPALETFRLWAHPNLLRVDYTLYVLSSLQGLHQGWHRLWDLEAQRLAFREIPGAWWFPNVYTPALSVAMIPFTRLSLEAGYALWRVVLLACMLLTWLLLAPRDWRIRVAFLPLLFATEPVRLGLVMGQILPVQMAALAVSFVLLERGREAAAGAVLAVIALKPQGLFLVPFALLAAGKRRFFASWALCMTAIGLGLLALVGLDGAQAYLHRLRYAESHLNEFWVPWSFALSRWFSSAVPLRLVEASAAGLALFIARQQRERPAVAVAAGLVASLIASPFVHPDDYMFLFPAAWLLLRAEGHPALAMVLLAGYPAMLVSGNPVIGGRWLLLFIGLLLPALALLPRKPTVVAA